MAAVDFLHHENPSTWARVKAANLGLRQRQTNYFTMPAKEKIFNYFIQLIAVLIVKIITNKSSLYVDDVTLIHLSTSKKALILLCLCVLPNSVIFQLFTNLNEFFGNTLRFPPQDDRGCLVSK
ncbi:hypothetical protein TNCV_1910741 [Trichonephila clavipes]|nr:hypothetical protein TNCV_1910741 [Trichonephila clavipes]